MKSLGFESFLKLTGGKGLHIVVPIDPKNNWTTVKEFAHRFVLAMEQQNPSLYLTKMTKAARKNRIYRRLLRNKIAPPQLLRHLSPRMGGPPCRCRFWADLLAAWTSGRVADFDTWKSRLSRDPWKAMTVLRQKLSISSSQLKIRIGWRPAGVRATFRHCTFR